MNGCTAGLFDRLLGIWPASTAAGQMPVEQIKDAVARDLEALLNTRVALPPDALANYPECLRSVLNYGLADFANMCMSSSDDQASICASLKTAIEHHEPRLRQVHARMERETGSINRVTFVISGRLVALPGAEPVNFDAVLQPSTLHYSIHRHARGAQP